jgi:hypothetical protein
MVDALEPVPLRPPGWRWRTSSLRLREGWDPGRQPWSSVPAGGRPVGPGIDWDGYVAMRAYEYVPASETTLTTHSEVLQAIKGLKFGKAASRNGVPNWVLRHVPKRAITFPTKMFNAVLSGQYFPPAWEHARVLLVLKPSKNPTLPSSYRPISLLDTVGKLIEKILLSRGLQKVNERGLLRDERFGFPPRHSSWPTFFNESTESLTRDG